MKKLKRDKSIKRKGFVSNNGIVLVALAGALTGLAVTYLLESEKVRSMLSQAGNSVKKCAGNLEMPALLRA